MSQLVFEEAYFYKYAMELFSRTGHNFASEPEFINHSPEQFVYFDNRSDVSLTRDERMLFQSFNCVTRLFSYNGCVFFSINLRTEKDERSHAAHAIHMMIHPIVMEKGTICLFRFKDEIMLSFMGYGYRCILSDWYSMNDDLYSLDDKLSIANMSIKRGTDYFDDMIYSLARSYYIIDQPIKYELFPIDFISSAEIDGVDREKLDDHIHRQLYSARILYGSDYVEYDDLFIIENVEVGEELDMMLLEMEDDENPINEETEAEENPDEDNILEEEIEEEERDIYEFDDVDPAIFQDPTLMVKWLERTEG